MKQLITLMLILACLSSTAQNKLRQNDDKSGFLITGTGVVFSIIAIAVPDGGNWTYSNGYNSKVINKSFFQQPTRVAMLGVGLTVSIGGLIYQKRNN